MRRPSGRGGRKGKGQKKNKMTDGKARSKKRSDVKKGRKKKENAS